MRFRVVQSSVPGAVELDKALWLLTDRALMTRLVCHEVDQVSSRVGRRPIAALEMLLKWVAQTYPDSVWVEPHARDALELMVVPEGAEELYEEIVDGAEVCEVLFMACTAETPTALAHDLRRLREAANQYWMDHPHPAA
jgi:hypothetical protein